MKKYEGLFIFSPEEGGEAAKEEEKRIDETISRFGGRTLDRQDWGRRLLGYALRKFREGRIVFWSFEMAAPQLADFRKALQLDEKILKTTIVKAPEPKPDRDAVKKSKAPVKENLRPTPGR